MLALEEQGSNPIQPTVRARIGVAVRFALPDRVLIELDALAGRAAEDHRPEAPVTHRQGFHPTLGGLGVPQFQASGSRLLAAPRQSDSRGKRCQELSTIRLKRHPDSVCPRVGSVGILMG